MWHFHNCKFYRHQGTHYLVTYSHSHTFLIYKRLILTWRPKDTMSATEFQKAHGSGIYLRLHQQQGLSFKSYFIFSSYCLARESAGMLTKKWLAMQPKSHATLKLLQRVMILGVHQHLDSLRQWEIAATCFKLRQEFVIWNRICALMLRGKL